MKIHFGASFCFLFCIVFSSEARNFGSINAYIKDKKGDNVLAATLFIPQLKAG